MDKIQNLSPEDMKSGNFIRMRHIIHKGTKILDIFFLGEGDLNLKKKSNFPNFEAQKI